MTRQLNELCMSLTATDIAALLQGDVIGDGAVCLTGIAPAAQAKAGDLTFAENELYFGQAEQSAAAAILVDRDFGPSRKTLLRVKNARVAFAKVLAKFLPEPQFPPGIHPSAVVAPSAQIDPSAHIGPYCVVGEQVEIGPRTVLRGGSHIGDQARVGADCHFFPNITIYAQTCIGQRVRVHAGAVIGSDGFGYVPDEGAHLKIPQIGNVIIHDDVEIGANVTIDRGALGSTVIGRGTKIDNLVQIAHNVIIGEHCLIIAQAGIAGSTRIGQYVTLAGQAGIAGHLKIGDRSVIAAQTGVMHNVPDDTKWLGSPAQPDRQAKRQIIAMTQLPALIQRVQQLEKQIRALTASSAPPE